MSLKTLVNVILLIVGLSLIIGLSISNGNLAQIRVENLKTIASLQQRLGTVDTVSKSTLISHSIIKPTQGVPYDRFVIHTSSQGPAGGWYPYIDTLVFAHDQVYLSRELPKETVAVVELTPFGHPVRLILYHPREKPVPIGNDY